MVAAHAHGQCTWGVAAQRNQLGLKLLAKWREDSQSLIPWEWSTG